MGRGSSSTLEEFAGEDFAVIGDLCGRNVDNHLISNYTNTLYSMKPNHTFGYMTVNREFRDPALQSVDRESDVEIRV